MTRIVTSDICTAFDPRAIGSQVNKHDTSLFLDALDSLIEQYDSSQDKVKGQHFVVCPEAMYIYVSAGDGLKTDNPDDYVVRNHREGPKMFLKREKAGKVNFLACVVYTLEAYLNDPDVTPEEAARVTNLGATGSTTEGTHVLVAVIASSGPASPVTPYRFVHNLAGGNNEYLPPRVPEEISAGNYQEWPGACANYCEELEAYITGIIGRAREVKEYWDKYSVVAD